MLTDTTKVLVGIGSQQIILAKTKTKSTHLVALCLCHSPRFQTPQPQLESRHRTFLAAPTTVKVSTGSDPLTAMTPVPLQPTVDKTTEA